MRARCFLWSLVAVTLAAADASAQAMRGRIIDDATGAPVGGAQVTLRNVEGRALAEAMSDSIGAFELLAEQAGAYAIAVTRLGYAAYTSPPLELPRGEMLFVEVRLGTAAVPLEPLVVTARRRPAGGRIAEFEERRRNPANAGGHFITGEEIERRPVATATQLLLAAPSVSLHPVILPEQPGGADRSMILFPGHQLRGGIQPGMCVAHVYVNGLYMRQSEDTTLDDLVDSSVLAGIEVYPRRVSAPIEYQRANDECGVVLVWTHEGQEGGDWSLRRIAAGLGVFLLLGVIATR